MSMMRIPSKGRVIGWAPGLTSVGQAACRIVSSRRRHCQAACRIGRSGIQKCKLLPKDSGGMRGGKGGITACASALAVVVLAWSVGSAMGGKSAHRSADARSLAAVARDAVAAETVSFDDARRAPVRVVRGPGKPAPPPAAPIRAETVSFGPADAAPVTVLRGGAARPVGTPEPAAQTRSEKVAFGDPEQPAVTVVRGAPTLEGFSMYL